MSGSPIVQAIQRRLCDAGYTNLQTPFQVAGVEFTFTGVMRGRDGRALDLVLLVDTTTGGIGDRKGELVQQRVEALSRALDVTGSRYVVTVILAGAVLTEGIEVLSETCRVLHVENATLDDGGHPANETAKRQLDDSIRVLLPLTLPAPLTETEVGGGPAINQLVHALPSSISTSIVEAVIAASSLGEQAVTDAVARVINGAFQPEQGDEQS